METAVIIVCSLVGLMLLILGIIDLWIWLKRPERLRQQAITELMAASDDYIQSKLEVSRILYSKVPKEIMFIIMQYAYPVVKMRIQWIPNLYGVQMGDHAIEETV